MKNLTLSEKILLKEGLSTLFSSITNPIYGIGKHENSGTSKDSPSWGLCTLAFKSIHSDSYHLVDEFICDHRPKWWSPLYSLKNRRDQYYWPIGEVYRRWIWTKWWLIIVSISIFLHSLANAFRNLTFDPSEKQI